jgi:Protein of unknown function (DUF1653)
MAYEGPGIYQHYKGGHYYVMGIAEHESEGKMLVIYRSYSVEHDLGRARAEIDFVARPLDSRDGADAFNEVVHSASGWIMRDGSRVHELPRFKRVA